MEIFVELKTYKVSFLCPECNAGYLIWTGRPIKPRKNAKKPQYSYPHICNNDKCEHKVKMKGIHYPRIDRKEIQPLG